ncbi:MAG: hypothetical protein IJM59_07985 [Proteobacteria bacterium]|nr:hypothetical protein [Pseudomonadota bacterium]
MYRQPKDKKTRYTTQYPHRESPLENLRMIREKGMDAFLEYETRKWTCPNCSTPFSVHHNICMKCRKRLKK